MRRVVACVTILISRFEEGPFCMRGGFFLLWEGLGVVLERSEKKAGGIPTLSIYRI